MPSRYTLALLLAATSLSLSGCHTGADDEDDASDLAWSSLEEPAEEEEDEDEGASAAEEEGTIGTPEESAMALKKSYRSSAAMNLGVLSESTTTPGGGGQAGMGGFDMLPPFDTDLPGRATPQPVVPPGASTDWGVNAWFDPRQDALSTFAVDVDTGSYTLTRRMLRANTLPSPAMVRVEEFLNYFDYAYPGPTDPDMPFDVHLEGGPSPLNPEHVVLRVGVQGRALTPDNRKPAHLTFLVDVSGSMRDPDKLGFARGSLDAVVDHMQPGDTIALVTYASSTQVTLPPTGYEDRERIRQAIHALRGGGGTAMGDGMTLAYQQALASRTPGSVSRVLVLSDGDANIGETSHEAILDSIEAHTRQGITLSTVGFGRGNYQDTRMEQLADKGDGNYVYIDSERQAHRVFVEQLGSTLQVIAKDVKIQVEFNPEVVASYRLIGYENRDIADTDFRNDRVDAGEIGADHNVTALYELKLTGKARSGGRLAEVRLRHKAPEATREDPAVEHTWTFDASALHARASDLSDDTRFALAVAAFADILRKSPDARAWSLTEVRALIEPGGDSDRAELAQLVDETIALKAMIERSQRP